jgi:ribosomal protein S18 acetylase RimI-like enzyme
MTLSHSRCGEPFIYNLDTAPTANATAIHEIYREVWSALAASTPAGEVFHQDGVLITSAAGKWPVMNTAFLSTPVATEADLQNRISVAKRYFGQKRRFWLFILFNDWLDSSIHPEQVFGTSGLSHMQNCVGMQTNSVIESATLAPELACRLIENDAERLEFSDINADSYGFSSEWSRDIATWTSQWPTRHVRLYIAYSGSDAVSTAMVCSIKDVAYLGFVATRRSHQRKGYAEAVARYALTATNEHWQFSKSILHSTPAALSLYRSLGYSEITSFGIYLGSCE